MMALFPEIDKITTKKSVDGLLSNFRSMLRIASEEYTPKVTTTFSLELKNFGNETNSQVESMVTRKVTAEQEIIKIVRAVNKLNAYDRKLIHDRYMGKQELSDIQLYLDYGTSERTFYRELDAALVRFAEGYENGRLLAEKWQEQVFV